MIYLNYYAKPKPKTTEEEMVKEYERTNNKINTLVFNTEEEIDKTKLANAIHVQDVSSVISSIYNKIWNMCYNLLHYSAPHGVYITDQLYTVFRIPKRTHGVRTITAPIDNLKLIQKTILNLLVNKLKILPHNAAHGCVKSRNCLTALKVHQTSKSRYFLKLDLHDAFGSVRRDSLKCALKNTAIMTNSGTRGAACIDAIVDIATHCTINGLPQGAPTSPFLLNVYLQQFDYELTERLREKHLTYTRYVDDLLISSKYPFDKDEIIQLVAQLLPEGMTINAEKTRYSNFNWSNWNLGIMYNNEGRLTVGYKNKKLIKNRIHNYNTREEERTVENYLQLSGILGYYKYIEPEYFSREQFTIAPPAQNS